MSRLLSLVLLASCSPVAAQWEMSPRPDGYQAPPGAQGLVLVGPTTTFPQQTQRWSVTASDLAVGERVEIGWGGEVAPGRCPYQRLVGGHLCLDIDNPARPMGTTTAIPHPTRPGEAIAYFDLAVPGTRRDVVHLQALRVDGDNSATSNTLEVELLSGVRCDVAGTPFGGGAGTQADPYLLCAPEHLSALAGQSSIHAQQVRPIDLAGTSTSYMDVGGDVAFDGGNQPILNYSSSLPLFRQFGAGSVVENVVMDNATVAAQGGQALGLFMGINQSAMTLRNFRISGSVYSTNGFDAAGGLVGFLANSVVENIDADVTVHGEKAGAILGQGHTNELRGLRGRGWITGSKAAGGVVGELGRGSTLEDSFSDARVHATASAAYAGGLVGVAGASQGNPLAEIRDSMAAGFVHGQSRIGGLVGWAQEVRISGSASWSRVSGTGNAIGGFVGAITTTSGGVFDSLGAPAEVAGLLSQSDCSIAGFAGQTTAPIARVVVAPDKVTMRGVNARDYLGGSCSTVPGSADIYLWEHLAGDEGSAFTDISSAPEDPATYPGLDFNQTWALPSTNPFATSGLLPVPRGLCGRQGIQCPPGDFDGDGVSDDQDVCPGGDDTIDANGDGTPDDCETQGLHCADILAQEPTAADGVYLIDPDGAGGVEPFEAWCDMTHQGGGWTLVLVRNAGASTSHASGVLEPTSVGQAIANDRWAALSALSHETLASTQDHTTSYVADLDVMRTASCVPLAADLTDDVIAHDEDSGCNAVGLDYSLWFGVASDLSDNALCFNRGSSPFWPSPLSAGFRPNPGLMMVR